MLGVKCGFGERYYRFESGGLKTATEVISENSSLYRSVRRHELMLEAALKELGLTEDRAEDAMEPLQVILDDGAEAYSR